MIGGWQAPDCPHVTTPAVYSTFTMPGAQTGVDREPWGTGMDTGHEFDERDELLLEEEILDAPPPVIGSDSGRSRIVRL